MSRATGVTSTSGEASAPKLRFFIRLIDSDTSSKTAKLLTDAVLPAKRAMASFQALEPYEDLRQYVPDRAGPVSVSDERVYFLLDHDIGIDVLAGTRATILLDQLRLSTPERYRDVAAVVLFRTSGQLDYAAEIMWHFSPEVPSQLFDAGTLSALVELSAEHPYFAVRESPSRDVGAPRSPVTSQTGADVSKDRDDRGRGWSPWRTEPEIARERQDELLRCLRVAPDATAGCYPFSSMALTRADVEWMLDQEALPAPDGETFPRPPGTLNVYKPGSMIAGWALSGKPAHPHGEEEGYSWFGFLAPRRDAVDLRGADLSGEDLSYLPLQCVRAGLWETELGQSEAWTPEMIDAAATNFEGARLTGTSLIGSVLVGAKMDGVDARGCDFSDADMRYVSLRGARLTASRLIRANLGRAELTGASCERVELALAALGGADLTDATLVRAHGEGSDFVEFRAAGRSEALGATLINADLSQARLEGSVLGSANAGTDASGCRLYGTVLAGASLRRVRLSGVDLSNCFLAGSDLREAHLEDASVGSPGFDPGLALDGGRLPAESISFATAEARVEASKAGDTKALDALAKKSHALPRVRRWLPRFPDEHPVADLRGAFFNGSSRIDGATLVRATQAGVRTEGLHWGGVDLSTVAWDAIPELGDEVTMRALSDETATSSETNLESTEAAVRANRQLAAALRDQGLVDEGDHFALRAKTLRRRALRLRRRWPAFLGSLVLAVLCGYGYRPSRALAAYVTVVVLFAGLLGVATSGDKHPLSVHDAAVASISAFHGRAIAPGATATLASTASSIGAVEGLLGLLIEVTLIATFTQRFLSR
jgi:uncharacterized protein YjbI with pentapeptide repeats